jgi:VWFA-related protein
MNMTFRIAIGLVFALVVLATDDSSESDARLLNLNVIALDNQGQPVKDLTSNDFQISDAGKRQDIAFFRRVENTRGQASKLGPNEFSNRTSTEVPHATVILFDLLNLSFGGRGYAANEIVRQLEPMQGSDDLYLYLLSLDGRLYTVRGLAGEEGQNPERGGEPWTRQIKPMMDRAMRTLLQMRSPDIDVAVRVQLTFAALDSLAAQLASVPGRKNIVWVSDGVPIALGPVRSDTGLFVDFTPLVRQLSGVFDHTGVSIYPVRQVFLGGSDHIGSTSGAGQTGGMGTGLQSLETLDEFASVTGGRPDAGKDVGSAVKRAMQDLRSSYQIAYYPPAKNWDSKYHKLRVDCKRKGVHIQTKTGYYAWPEPLGAESKQVIDTAVSTMLDAAEIGLRGTLSPDPKDKAGLDVDLHIEANDIAFIHTGDQYVAQLRLALIGYLPDGQMQASPVVPMNLHYTAQQYDDALKNGITSSNVVRKEKMNKLRLVVYDRSSNTYGSLTMPINEAASSQLR